MAEKGKKVFTIGGDASSAVNAFRQVQSGFKTMRREASRTGRVMANAFKLAGSALRKMGSYIRGTMLGLFRKMKWGILGAVGAIALMTTAWNREAAAQARMGAVLKANVKNWRDARKEIRRITRGVQRRTNFGDRDVESIFTALIATLGGDRGFGAARSMVGSILDVASVQGMEPRMVAETVARNIAMGTVGETFRKFGIRTSPDEFKRMGLNERIATTSREMGALAPGAAGAESRVNPFKRMLNNFGDVVEQFGRMTGSVVNPALERLAYHAQQVAEQLSAMKPKDIWDKFRQYAKEAWDTVKALAATAFSFVSERAGFALKSTKLGAMKAAFNIPNFIAKYQPGMAKKLGIKHNPMASLVNQLSVTPPAPFNFGQSFRQNYQAISGGGSFSGSNLVQTAQSLMGPIPDDAPQQGGMSPAQSQAMLQAFANMSYSDHQKVAALQRRADNATTERVRGALMPA